MRLSTPNHAPAHVPRIPGTPTLPFRLANAPQTDTPATSARTGQDTAMPQSKSRVSDKKRLRPHDIGSENQLWQILRHIQVDDGLRFRRDAALGPYVADFYCAECQLVIESAARPHSGNSADTQRHAWMAERGLRVLRIWHRDVLNDPGAVKRAIQTAARSVAKERPGDDRSIL